MQICDLNISLYKKNQFVKKKLSPETRSANNNEAGILCTQDTG